MDIRILYEDKHLMLVGKPAGVPSQPDPSGQTDLLSVLREGRPGAALVHRLDTPTGGVMAYAKTPAAAAGLSALVQDHAAFVKEYLCVTAAPPEPPEGRMTDLLYHDTRTNKTFVTARPRPGAKEAVLSYRTLAVAPDGHALTLVRLYTGRTHQIRAQFASRQTPLCGDGKYGSREKCPFIALWSFRLSFVHPVTGRPVSAVCTPDPAALPWSLFDLPGPDIPSIQ